MVQVVDVDGKPLNSLDALTIPEPFQNQFKSSSNGCLGFAGEIPEDFYVVDLKRGLIAGTSVAAEDGFVLMQLRPYNRPQVFYSAMNGCLSIRPILFLFPYRW